MNIRPRSRLATAGALLWLALMGFCFAQSAVQQKAEIQQALAAGDMQRAGRLAQEGAKRWPQDADFVHIRGKIYFRANQLDRAQQDFETARRLAPQDKEIAFDLGLLFMARQNYDAAANALSSAIQDPALSRTALPHILLGRAYQNSNRSELAIDEFKVALRLDPSVRLGHYHLGYGYQSIGKNQEAMAEYEKELARTQDVPEVHYQYGHVLLEAGDLAKAESRLRAALALDPRNADAQYDLGKCLLQKGDLTAAIRELQRGADLAPESPNPYFLLSKALARSGDKAGAKAAAEKFAELKKNQKDSGGMATGRIR